MSPSCCTEPSRRQRRQTAAAAVAAAAAALSSPAPASGAEFVPTAVPVVGDLSDEQAAGEQHAGTAPGYESVVYTDEYGHVVGAPGAASYAPAPTSRGRKRAAAGRDDAPSDPVCLCAARFLMSLLCLMALVLTFVVSGGGVPHGSWVALFAVGCCVAHGP